MCGIAGIVNFGTSSHRTAGAMAEDQRLVRQMCQLQAHRGPDMEEFGKAVPVIARWGIGD